MTLRIICQRTEAVRVSEGERKPLSILMNRNHHALGPEGVGRSVEPVAEGAGLASAREMPRSASIRASARSSALPCAGAGAPCGEELRGGARLGAYAAWPPMTAKALYKIDSPDQTSRWLREVAKAGNQGPIGQAHFVEDVYPPVNGGAFKSSEDAPFIEDWCCIAAGAFTELVIDSIFGAELTLSHGIRVNSHLASFDLSARLEDCATREGCTRSRKMEHSARKRNLLKLRFAHTRITLTPSFRKAPPSRLWPPYL